MRQLALAATYSDTGSVGFSVPEYLTPWGGPAAARLYAVYLGWLKVTASPQIAIN